MSSRLPSTLLPAADKLSALFFAVSGLPTPITAADRDLLLRWEDGVRDRVMAMAQAPTAAPHRWRLPDERDSITARFELPGEAPQDDFVGYITMGMYHDGSIGEIFLSMAKEGTFTSGIVDAFVTAVSIGLQHGIPLQVFIDKFKHSNFSPSGLVRGAPVALRGFYKSILDYLFHYLEHRFPDGRLASNGETVTKTKEGKTCHGQERTKTSQRQSAH